MNGSHRFAEPGEKPAHLCSRIGALDLRTRRKCISPKTMMWSPRIHAGSIDQPFGKAILPRARPVR